MSTQQSAEPAITCPKCGAEIKLTESLAAPLVAATRLEYENRLAEKEQERETRIAEGVAREREKITLEEAAKAKKAIQDKKEIHLRVRGDTKERWLRSLKEKLKEHQIQFSITNEF